ncbi:unnamed protein product [Pleuronectes platessa]|uniref:Uncharacterized protein n=1 Tax=Pleuronectes platessa TaxID=8262 RepID=A0A9N7UDZ8_PLEPL|nr:unnamed protein product [Pleuronectes platessa]
MVLYTGVRCWWWQDEQPKVMEKVGLSPFAPCHPPLPSIPPLARHSSSPPLSLSSASAHPSTPPFVSPGGSCQSNASPTIPLELIVPAVAGGGRRCEAESRRWREHCCSPPLSPLFPPSVSLDTPRLTVLGLVFPLLAHWKGEDGPHLCSECISTHRIFNLDLSSGSPAE